MSTVKRGLIWNYLHFFLRRNLTESQLPGSMRPHPRRSAMASNSASPPKVPTEMLNERRKGWHGFTQFIIINCAALAVFLLLMLLFFKIL
jgi:hypothetical protein